MRAHEYPKPMWNADGAIAYAPNRQEEDKMHGQGWSTTPVKQEFPRAMHAAGGQSLQVRNQEELDRAIKNGWKLKPVVQEVEQELPPSCDRPPVGFDEEPETVGAGASEAGSSKKRKAS